MKTLYSLIATRFAALAFAITVLCGASSHAQTVVFSDSFDRADGTVGNDWIISSTGNVASGGGGTAPTAAISDGKIALNRAGWGPNATIALTQNISRATSVSATLLAPGATWAAYPSGYEAVTLRATDSITGAFVRVSLFNYNSDQFTLRIAKSTDGSWQDWGYSMPLGAITNPGDVRVTINVGAAGIFSVTAYKLSDSSIVATWSSTNAGMTSGTFDKVQILGEWNAWTSPSTYRLFVDDITATAIPEPSMIAMIAGSLVFCAAMIVRRRP